MLRLHIQIQSSQSHSVLYSMSHLDDLLLLRVCTCLFMNIETKPGILRRSMWSYKMRPVLRIHLSHAREAKQNAIHCRYLESSRLKVYNSRINGLLMSGLWRPWSEHCSFCILPCLRKSEFQGVQTRNSKSLRRWIRAKAALRSLQIQCELLVVYSWQRSC